MTVQITGHLFNDIGVLGITNGNQATMFHDKGHGKSFIVCLILFQVQDIVDKGHSPIFTMIIHVGAFISIQCVLNGFLVQTVDFRKVF